ncbi:MAG: sugar phosphate isomerase/epimerase family protein [Chloroflexota bacterium]
MDLSFSTSAGTERSWTLEAMAEWAALHEFDCVRLAAAGDADPERVLAEGPDRIKSTLAGHGLYLAALQAGSSTGAPLQEDAARMDRNQERMLRVIDAAAALGTPIVVTNTGSPYRWHFYGMPSSPPGNPTDHVDEVIALFKERFTPLVRRAEEKGVKIALDTAVRMGNIACVPEMWERCLAAIPSDHLGLSCDPSHLLWLHVTPVEDAIRLFPGKWYYADVKDCEISQQMLFRQGIIGNWWWQYRVPGRGQLNWGTIIGALSECGYDYVMCVENEDRGVPGLEGFDIGRRHLAQFLPDKRKRWSGRQPPEYGGGLKTPWRP